MRCHDTKCEKKIGFFPSKEKKTIFSEKNRVFFMTEENRVFGKKTYKFVGS